MEKKQERVLAYTKAIPLSQDDLVNVSGGMTFCHHQTLRLSNVVWGSMDASMDITVDW
jgi:hypothetical protein